MILGVDVSVWNKNVDWKVLKAAGVEFAIIKATQGNYKTDAMLKTHVAGARNAGMIVGLYHWCDPLVSVEGQAHYFIKNIDGLAPDLVAVDMEQYWADWGEWSRKEVTKILPPKRISDSALSILKAWKEHLNLPSAVYTRATFVHSYAMPATTWLKDYHLWMAYYPYKASRVVTTWEEFKTKHKPSISAPALPNGCNTWKFWQFTGDKFVLPGVDTALDVNYFNGDLNGLKSLLGLPQDATPTQPETPAPSLTLEERVARLERLAVRDGWKLD